MLTFDLRRILSLWSFHSFGKFIYSKPALNIYGNVFTRNSHIFINPTSKYATLTLYKQAKISNPISIPSDDICKFLKTSLKCSNYEASDIAQEYYDFLLDNRDTIIERIKLLEKNGFYRNTVKDNFWLLVNNLDQLKSKIGLLKRWKFRDINHGVSILKLSYLQMVKYTLQAELEINFTGGMNRITYFATLTKCEEKRACEVFVKYFFMMNIKLTTMKEILEMVASQGILIEDLLQDMWLFNYSPKSIAKRIAYLESIKAKEKCSLLKPWMLRCTNVTVNRFFELKEENLAALGSYSNLEDLLINELGLTSSEVSGMFSRHHPLMHISYAKAKEMIDFLKLEGFDAKAISSVPRVLCHKQETLKSRLTELRMVAPQLATLHNICRNKKDFIAFLKKCPSSTNKSEIIDVQSSS